MRGGRNRHRHGAGHDLVVRGLADGDDWRRGIRRSQRIAREQPLVGREDRHGVGFANGEPAGIQEAQEGVGIFFDVGTRFGHGAVGSRGANAEPVQHGVLIVIGIQQPPAIGGHVVGVSASQPSVVGGFGAGGQISAAVMIAHHVGFVVQRGPRRGDETFRRQTRQRSKGKLRIAKQLFPPTSRAVAEIVEIDGAGGEGGLCGDAAIRHQLGIGEVGAQQVERHKAVGVVPAGDGTECAFGTVVIVGGVERQVTGTNFPDAWRVLEAIKQGSGDTFHVAHPCGQVAAQHNVINLARQVFRGDVRQDWIAQQREKIGGGQRRGVCGDAHRTNLVRGDAVLAGVIFAQLHRLRGIGVHHHQRVEGPAACVNGQRSPARPQAGHQA